MTSPYTEQQKADAIAQALAGTPYSEISQSLGVPVGTIKSWVSRSTTAVATVATTATRGQQLEETLSIALDRFLVTLTRQAEHYGSDSFIQGQPAATVLESTRTLGSIFVRIMDRLKGQPIPAGANDED